VASRFVRKVRTASGAVAVQIVVKVHGEVVEVEHIGSAHSDAELAVLLAAARERLHPGQGELDLGPLPEAVVSTEDVADWTRSSEDVLALSVGVERSPGRPAVVAGGGRVVATASLLLWEVLETAYARLGFDAVADEVFKSLVLARIVEPTSKADTIRVLDEIGVAAPALRTIWRALARCVERDYRNILAQACLARSASTAAGRLSLVLYDCTTLHFETDEEDTLRRVGMSKERRVDPQIQVGVRHEALCVRREVQDLPRLSVAGDGVKLRAA
jgi:hypothetical protein